MISRLHILFGLTLYLGSTEHKKQPDIVKLGYTITEQLANNTKVTFESVLNNFSSYLKFLQEINDLIWSPNGIEVSKGMRFFDDLEEVGGPPHTAYDLDFIILDGRYDWAEDETKQIKSLMNDTRLLWEAVKDRANRLRIGTWGVDSKVEDEDALQGNDDSDGELH